MADLYDTDIAAWAEHQADALRRRAANEIDWENVAEEIESLARSDRREIRNRLVVICEHLLKWAYQPGQRSGSWRGSVVEARDQIDNLVQESPSLKDYPAAVLIEAYRPARRKAEAEIGLVGLPEACPWTIAQVLSHTFWPPSEEDQQPPE
jgi:Domain of unknown function DUF29